MGGKKKKAKRRKSGEDPGADQVSSDEDNASVSSSENQQQDNKDKYEDFRVPDYVRSYPENGGAFEYIVFIESIDSVPIGDRDMMSLANNFKKYNKGVKQLIRMNRYKVGAIFERPALANAALNNKKFLDSFKLKASIPASATEITGVIQHVPTNLSNSQIYSAISSTKNIICIKRFMRRVTVTENDKTTLEPTKTVSITFSCAALPDSVDLNSWRFEVRPYTPPVKQCLKCLRYGHIAKFCKNSQRCSICAHEHSFKVCIIPPSEAKCCHCGGKHVSVSAQCPVKQKKMEEIKNKIHRKSYAEAFNEKSFPSLPSPKISPSEQFLTLIKTEQISNMLLQVIFKLLTQARTNDQPLNVESVKNILYTSLQDTVAKS